jgi:hypothetical protein
MLAFSVPFIKNFKYDSDVYEYTIEYDFDEDTPTELMEFLNEYPNKKVVIDIQTNIIDIKQCAAIVKNFPNITYRLDLLSAIAYHQELNEHKIPFMLYGIVENLDMLHSFLQMGVSQITIGYELGFLLPRIFTMIKRDYPLIKIRVYPNFYQHIDYTGEMSFIKGFFVRPEDIRSYAQFVNIFELAVPENKKEGLKVLWEAYVKTQMWYGDLKPLINGLPQSLDNRVIIPSFGPNRIKCGKRCYLDSGCNLCERILDLGETFIDKEVFLIPRKEENKDGR